MYHDNELFAIAQALLEQRHTPPVHTVAAALRCQSGEVISAVNIDLFLASSAPRQLHWQSLLIEAFTISIQSSLYVKMMTRERSKLSTCVANAVRSFTIMRQVLLS